MTRDSIRDSERRRSWSSAEFLSACGVVGSQRGEKVALALRAVIAKLAGIAPEQLSGYEVVESDLRPLGMWDSLDEVSFVLELERELRIRIPDAAAERIPFLAEGTRGGGLTVGEMVRAQVVYLLQHGLLGPSAGAFLSGTEGFGSAEGGS